MSRTSIVAEGRALTVNFDDPRLRGDLFQSIVIGQILDELTGKPVVTPLKVSSTLLDARTKTAANGIGGVVGIPRRLFPILNAFPFPPFEVTYEVRGYVPVTETITLAAQGTFPTTFASVDLGQIPARRTPISLTGRTVGQSVANQTVPVDNAAVEVTGIWRLVEDVDVIGGPVVTPIAGLAPTLYASRPLGANLEIVSLNPVVEPPRVLLEAASKGQREVLVSHSIGLTATDVLGFDKGDRDREEHIEVEAVAASNDPNSPATARLRFPLKRNHARFSPAQLVAVPAPGPADATLADSGAPGDVTLFVNSTAAFGSSQLVRITGGTAVPEYATLLLYQAISDPDGYYRLPEISRVAAFEVSASRALPLPALSGSSPFTPTYALYENRLDLIMS